MAFNTAASNDFYNPGDHVSVLTAFTVIRDGVYQGKFGDITCVYADVTLCDGLKAGVDFGDQRILNAPLVNALTPFIGSDPVLGRIREIQVRGNTSYVLDPATEQDMTVAEKYFQGDTAPVASDEIPF